MITHHRSAALGFAWALLTAASLQGQVVNVTLRLDTNRVEVGSATILRAFAQVIPQQQPVAQIFSWYVDLVNTGGSIASGDFANLKRPVSDQDLRTSSSGTTDGANQRGIYDTFIDLPGAGRDAPVELFSVPVKGLAPGRATFRAEAGSGVAGLGPDFVVAPSSGGEPLLGGEYSGALAQLEVIGASPEPTLFISSSPLPPLGRRLTITFSPIAGQTHFIEFQSDLGSDSGWQPLPGGPHNSGSAIDTNSFPSRFYRLRVAP